MKTYQLLWTILKAVNFQFWKDIDLDMEGLISAIATLRTSKHINANWSHFMTRLNKASEMIREDYKKTAAPILTADTVKETYPTTQIVSRVVVPTDTHITNIH